VFAIAINQIEVKLENFEGPLDLLIYLIKKNEMNIYDISISRIADQFLEAIKGLETIELEMAADFISMATHLLFLKSKMLLPLESFEESDSEVLEEKYNLTQRLLEYSFYKDVADFLDNCENSASKYLIKQESDKLTFQSSNVLDAYVLAEHYYSLICKEKKSIKIDTEKINFKDIINYIKEVVFKNKVINFKDLVQIYTQRREVSAALVAILELVKLKIVCAVQKCPFEQIYIKQYE
jgi:segregation and condensation protein A